MSKTRPKQASKRDQAKLLRAVRSADAPALSVADIAAKVDLHQRVVEAEVFDLVRNGELVAYRSADIVLFCLPKHYRDD
jgi:hypothetical protein